MTRLCSLEGIINYNVVRPMLYSLGISVKGYCASTVCIVNKRYDICSRDVSQSTALSCHEAPPRSSLPQTSLPGSRQGWLAGCWWWSDHVMGCHRSGVSRDLRMWWLWLTGIKLVHLVCYGSSGGSSISSNKKSSTVYADKD